MRGESTTSVVGGRAIACKLWICALILNGMAAGAAMVSHTIPFLS